MNELVKKILERLEKERRILLENNIQQAIALNFAKGIVQEVAEEYKDGWIACSKRLPEKNGMYLCTQNSYDLATNKKIIRVSTELVEFYDGKWRRAKNLVITHWQPLPEPFKERD